MLNVPSVAFKNGWFKVPLIVTNESSDPLPIRSRSFCRMLWPTVGLTARSARKTARLKVKLAIVTDL